MVFVRTGSGHLCVKCLPADLPVKTFNIFLILKYGYLCRLVWYSF